MVASGSPLSGSISAISLPVRDRAGGALVGGQRDRDRPEQAARHLHAVAHALPVGMGHEAVERREAADAEHDDVALFARADAQPGQRRGARASRRRAPRPRAAAAAARRPPCGLTNAMMSFPPSPCGIVMPTSLASTMVLRAMVRLRAKKNQRSARSPAYCTRNAGSSSAVDSPADAGGEKRAGSTNAPARNSHLTARRRAAVVPWKNSRVLNEPPMKPCDFCTMRGCLMPIAVCSVDFGPQAAVADQRRDAGREREQRQHAAPTPAKKRAQVRGEQRGEGRGQREAGRAAHQRVVDHRQRARPLAQEGHGRRRSSPCRRTARTRARCRRCRGRPWRRWRCPKAAVASAGCQCIRWATP